MTQLSEQEIVNIKAFIDNLTAAKKHDSLNDLTAEKLKARIYSIAESDKNKNNKIDPTEAIPLIQGILSTNPSGDKILHGLCERAAIDDEAGKNSRDVIIASAAKAESHINFIREIAKATQKGMKTPEAAIESYRFMELGTTDQGLRSYVDKANKEISVAMSEQISEILKKDKSLADKAANLPDTTYLRTLDADNICIGVNKRGIGRSI